MNNSERLYATDSRLVAFASLLESSPITNQWRWGVVSASRTESEQQKLYSQGRTSPGNIVTYASRPDESPHVLWQGQSDAVDFAPRNDGNTDYDWGNDAAFQALGDLAQQQGLVWGGNFPGFADDSHVETPDWRARRKRQAKGNAIALLAVMALALSNCAGESIEASDGENMITVDFDTVTTTYPFQLYGPSSNLVYGARIQVLQIGGTLSGPDRDEDATLYDLAYRALILQYQTPDGITRDNNFSDDGFSPFQARSISIPINPVAISGGPIVRYRAFLPEQLGETPIGGNRSVVGNVIRTRTDTYSAASGTVDSPIPSGPAGLVISDSENWRVVVTGHGGFPDFGGLYFWFSVDDGITWSRGITPTGAAQAPLTSFGGTPGTLSAVMPLSIEKFATLLTPSTRIAVQAVGITSSTGTLTSLDIQLDNSITIRN